MPIMGTKTISCDDPLNFDKQVRDFLERKEGLILHEKTTFAITMNDYRNQPYEYSQTIYSVIFYGELGNKKRRHDHVLDSRNWFES